MSNLLFYEDTTQLDILQIKPDNWIMSFLPTTVTMQFDSASKCYRVASIEGIVGPVNLADISGADYEGLAHEIHERLVEMGTITKGSIVEVLFIDCEKKAIGSQHVASSRPALLEPA